MRSNQELIDCLKSEGWLKTQRVIEAFQKTDRARFVPESLRGSAYENRPLHVARGQTISQPLVVALMTEALDVPSGARVLEVGAGSGYQAAILSELVGEAGRVYTVDRLSELVEFAKKSLSGYGNVEVRFGDGSKGLPESAPFDRVIVTAACPRVPEPLAEQLRVGGKMVLPVESLFGQDLLLIEKEAEKKFASKKLLDVVFVPLVGEYGYPP